MKRLLLSVVSIAAACGIALVGCGSDDDDPAGSGGSAASAGKGGGGAGKGGGAGEAGNAGAAGAGGADECPTDLFAGEGTACSSEGQSCQYGGDAPCTYANFLRCQGGKWVHFEATPGPGCGGGGGAGTGGAGGVGGAAGSEQGGAGGA